VLKDLLEEQEEFGFLPKVFNCKDHNQCSSNDNGHDDNKLPATLLLIRIYMAQSLPLISNLPKELIHLYVISFQQEQHDNKLI
jgi:hypothetical protein